MAELTDRVGELVGAVCRGGKYHHVCRDFVRHVGTRELASHRSFKEAVKGTRNKLHQVAGAYAEAKADYGSALAELFLAVNSPDREELRRACQRIMSRHVSTRERLPILAEFYAETLGSIPPPKVVLDVACGLNPLAILWMPLGEDAVYYAYDIYTNMIAFLGEALPLLGVRGEACARDIAQSPPTQHADLALILKTIPCLEQVSKGSGFRLLDALDADYLLISFPVHSIGGRDKGMASNYEAAFLQAMQGKPWSVQRFAFASELAFLVRKGRVA